MMEPAVMDLTVYWLLRLSDKDAKMLKGLVQNVFQDEEAEDVRQFRQTVFEALKEVRI